MSDDERPTIWFHLTIAKDDLIDDINKMGTPDWLFCPPRDHGEVLERLEKDLPNYLALGDCNNKDPGGRCQGHEEEPAKEACAPCALAAAEEVALVAFSTTTDTPVASFRDAIAKIIGRHFQAAIDTAVKDLIAAEAAEESEVSKPTGNTCERLEGAMQVLRKDVEGKLCEVRYHLGRYATGGLILSASEESAMNATALAYASVIDLIDEAMRTYGASEPG